MGATNRLQFVQQKYAEHLEVSGEFSLAEEYYLKANKGFFVSIYCYKIILGREAILMHMHNQNWEVAERIARFLNCLFKYIII